MEPSLNRGEEHLNSFLQEYPHKFFVFSSSLFCSDERSGRGLPGDNKPLFLYLQNSPHRTTVGINSVHHDLVRRGGEGNDLVRRGGAP